MSYLISPRTDGANPFMIFESCQLVDQGQLCEIIKAMPYKDFLGSAYWFGVSHTAKAKAGMRCQVCNSYNHLAVHHRTYDTHGKEHLHMMDLVVMCQLCHGLFHGHREPAPHAQPEPLPVKETPKPGAQPGAGGLVVLTPELIAGCSTHRGGFTSKTVRAFGLTFPLRRGWVKRLVGREITEESYLLAFQSRH